jgi:leader peptidase (prepilin peptidase) / N-methyltransferase
MGAALSKEVTVVLEASQRAPASAEPSRERLVRNHVPVGLLATALAALACTTYPAFADAAIAAFMAIVLVVLAATDLERRIIPNRVVVPAIAIVLIARIAVSPGRASEYIVAALGAGLAFLVPNFISRSLMGMGDVKLAAFLGAGLGWGVIGAVAIAFISIFPFAVGTLIRGGLAARKSTLPFGPFLAFGGLVILIVPRLVGVGGG